MCIRILIVDDSPFSRKMTIRSLPEGYEFDIVEARDGREGLDTYMEQMPDLVLMDLTMPVMDGLESTEAILAEDPEARVIVITADVQPEVRERCHELGALDFLPKPVDKDALRRVIADLF